MHDHLIVDVLAERVAYYSKNDLRENLAVVRHIAAQLGLSKALSDRHEISAAPELIATSSSLARAILDNTRDTEYLELLARDWIKRWTPMDGE